MRLHVSCETGLALGYLPLDAMDLQVRLGQELLPSQWVPEGERSGGLLLVQLPGPGEYTLELQPLPEESAQPAVAATTGLMPPAFAAQPGAGAFPLEELRFDVKRGGFPVLPGVAFEDAVYRSLPVAQDADETPYRLANDALAGAALLSAGPLARVVRTRARYCDAAGQPTPEGAYAVYDWYLFPQGPAYVRAELVLPGSFSPPSFLALRFPGAEQRAVGLPHLEEPVLPEPLASDGYAALLAGPVMVAALGTRAQVEGDLLTGDVSLAPRLLPGDREQAGAFLFLGRAGAEELPRLLAGLPSRVAYRLESEDASAAGSAAALSYPLSAVHTYGGRAFQLDLAFREGGLHVADIRRRGRSWQALNPPPLFRVFAASGEIPADSGWERAEFSEDYVDLIGRPNGRDSRVRLTFTETKSGLDTGIICQIPNIESITYPEIMVTNGPLSAFLPLGPGQEEREVNLRGFHYRKSYAAPFAVLSLLGTYDGAGEGFSLAWLGEGERRELCVDSDPERRALALTARLYPEGQYETGVYRSPTVAIRATDQGWWGVCQAYRPYAQAAPWSGGGKQPTWLDEQDFWFCAHVPLNPADPGPFVATLKGDLPQGRDGMETWTLRILAAQRMLGLPVAVHAYNWHNSPHDHDYPHYFPTRPGFREAVAAVQAQGVKVMPYINGRLWDIHDRGTEDWQFTARALPAATKQRDGSPWLETYGSREEDGSPVRFAVMCPAAPLWRQTLADICRRLQQELGVDAIYIDQIAAMEPALCQDPTHGHPLGGGGWWRKAYAELLQQVRAAAPGMPLTTECNAEPYVDQLDGYLTWHQMFPGQVPAFPSLYSGKVRTFGRHHRGEPTLPELRSMLAQAFLFGEQLGWIAPEALLLLGEPLAAFIRLLVGLRQQLRPFFNEGEMLRPPELETTQSAYRWGWEPRRTLLPDVMAARWRCGGETRLLLVNPTGSPQRARWPQAPALPALIAGDGEVAWEQGGLELALPPASAAVLRLPCNEEVRP